MLLEFGSMDVNFCNWFNEVDWYTSINFNYDWFLLLLMNIRVVHGLGSPIILILKVTLYGRSVFQNAPGHRAERSEVTA